jgi:hypothetical protein
MTILLIKSLVAYM